MRAKDSNGSARKNLFMEKQTRIKGERISYSLRESGRAKRPRIDFRKGRIRVTIPENSKLDPEEVLESKSGWVLEKWSEAEEFREKIPERSFEEGGKIPVLGEEKEIFIEKRRSSEVEENIFLAEHLVERNGVKEEVRNALKKKSRRVFQEKADEFSEEVGGGFEKIFLRDQETRWGSCSSKNNLNFNWRLVLGPEKVLEYVVVHELVHLEEMNHSERFWSKVESIFPEHRESRNWLEENSAKLVFDF